MRALPSVFLMALAFALAAAPAAGAGVVAVYAPAPADMEVLRAAALPGAPVPAGFSVRVSESSSLSAEFSVPAGTSAYFRGDSLETLPGFEMRGESVLFESAPQGEALDKRSPAAGEAARAFSTALRSARWEPDGLRLGYALAAPARVTAEVYAASGRVLAAREWTESRAGVFERRIPAAHGAGPVFVRWKTGNVTAVLKVTKAAKAARAGSKTTP